MRSRTPSDIKWLTNEAAMLEGELQRLDEEIARLVAHRAEVERSRCACLRTLETVARAAPALLPVVRAHRPYGRRGGLHDLLKEALRNAAPNALDTRELSLLAIETLGLTFPSPESLRRFNSGTVARALRRFAEQGLIERAPTRIAGRWSPGVWRWKGMLPTFKEIAQQAVGGAERLDE